MKAITFGLIFFSLISCKKEQSPQIPSDTIKTEIEEVVDKNIDDTLFFSEKDLELSDQKKKSIKKEQLVSAKDDKAELQELVISKEFFKEEDLYVLDYKYPYLNENINPSYAAFNDYINETYLNIESTENQILEDKELLCDTLKIKRFRDKRTIDYKIYTAKNNLISALLYKENYYSGAIHSSYMFESLNFDLKKSEFIYFNDFFVKNSEKEIFTIINKIIKNSIESGEIYYDCWEISDGDFKAYKNNFVVTDDTLEFYFDDCIICPSYTGTYSIKIPIQKIMHLIKNYSDRPDLS